ncbi:helix-turn-helix transcriptional regulator [Reticulibacter mediterranei]|uniref:Helix-turn-helix transcriptional regulator n=1 Tax=Reticulibacter mediterranei TaxID=2778369 RepID=A0A8J3IRL8_9CHLR|nr:LuxR C-terminal-related transcriptional regulator [Reticulibacter mediterranei]GHO94086.1 helix-turn-helix transcriptional regulator [Reticulibacter mediterranei]
MVDRQKLPAHLQNGQLQIIEAKLHAPRLSPDLVRREHLLARLDEGRTRKLTLLSAPAGSGKTSLVCQWLTARRADPQFPPLAWIALDAEDNDPQRFWRYVITACQNVLPVDAPDAMQPVFALLQAATQTPFESSALDEVLIALLNALMHVSEGILVLEDYHVIIAPQIHRTMAFLLDHLPETLHLLIITRNEPPLSLARLRASGNLCEVHMADLRFSIAEIQGFLQQKIRVPLTERIIKQMNIRLDGWAAGLRLLSLALQDQTSQQDVERLLTSFAGNNRPLQVYFVSEVLALQSESCQRFLLQTSILSRLTASLCDSVTERDDGEHMLKMLESMGLFVESLDESGRWYRYHTLFAEAMREEASRRLGAATLQTASHRASLWFERQDMLPQAIEAALTGGDVARIVALIEQFTTTLRFLELHEYHTLIRWLEYVPLSRLKQVPSLCLNYAVARVFVSMADRLDALTLARVEELLQAAETGFRGTANAAALGQLLALRAWIAWGQDAIEQAAMYAQQALLFLSEDAFPWYSIAENIIGIRRALLEGQYHLAYSIFQKTRAACEVSGNRAFIRTITVLMGWVCFEQGQLHLAGEYCRQVLASTSEQKYSSDRGHALLGTAQIAYERNDLAMVEQYVQEAYALGQVLADEECQIRSQLLQARGLHARGEASSAMQLVTSLLARIQPQTLPMLYRDVLLVQIGLYLALGDLVSAQRQVASLHTSQQKEPLSCVQREQDALLIARLHLARGGVQDALTELTRLLEAALKAERQYSILRIQVLLALAEFANKQLVEARQRILQVIALAHLEGHQRLFLDEGATMEMLLRGIVSQVQDKLLSTYLHTLLQAFAQSSVSSQPIEALSPQEMRVLRLLATGSSSPQIARELIVSVNTVRTQIQSIYRKLQVNNRVAACETARALNLL